MYLRYMLYWSGDVYLTYDTTVRKIPIRVLLDGNYDLKIETNAQFDYGALTLGNRDDLALAIESVDEPIPVFITSGGSEIGGESLIVFQTERSPVWSIEDDTLLRARTTLINFGGRNSPYVRVSDLKLAGAGWTVSLTSVHSDLLEFPESLKTHQYAPTHQLEIARTDGSTFSTAQLQKLTCSLSDFFSFAHGAWVATAFTVGFGADGRVQVTEWGVGRSEAVREPDGVLSPFSLAPLAILFPLFMTKIEDEGWQDAISHAIYWMRRARMENAGPDGGVILLQAVLERFAWHLLVRDGASISEKGFSELAAADQIRLFASVLKLPKRVPETLPALLKFARANGLDAPEAFTRLRNRIVHPPKLSAKGEKPPLAEAYFLGRWYVELAVLSACGYNGEYTNLANYRRWLGQVEAVPWS